MQTPPLPAADTLVRRGQYFASYGPRDIEPDTNHVTAAADPARPQFWGVYTWEPVRQRWQWESDRATESAARIAALALLPNAPLDLCTVAYIAIGVHAAIRDLGPEDDAKLQARKDEGHGEDGIIRDAVDHAQLLDNLCEELAPDGLNAVWAYEVAEPFGALWLRAYIDRADFDATAVGAALIKEFI